MASRSPGLVRDLLLQNQTIESLRLETILNNASLLPVAEGIRGNDSLTELNLAQDYCISSLGHLMPLRLILNSFRFSDEGFNEISEALEGQVRLDRLEFHLGTRIECTLRLLGSLAINEHLVDLNAGILSPEQIGVLTDTIGSFKALARLDFSWPGFDMSIHLKTDFLAAMNQNDTFYPYGLAALHSRPARLSRTLSAISLTVTVVMKLLSGLVGQPGCQVASSVVFCQGVSPRGVLLGNDILEGDLGGSWSPQRKRIGCKRVIVVTKRKRMNVICYNCSSN